MTERATYALLIYRTSAQETGAEGSARALDGHRALQEQVVARGGLHAVARLNGVDEAKTVRISAGAHDISDGPYIDAKEWLVGFYLLDCASEAEALEHAQAICTGPDHAIEVRPVGWRWRA